MCRPPGDNEIVVPAGMTSPSPRARIFMTPPSCFISWISVFPATGDDTESSVSSAAVPLTMSRYPAPTWAPPGVARAHAFATVSAGAAAFAAPSFATIFRIGAGNLRLRGSAPGAATSDHAIWPFSHSWVTTKGTWSPAAKASDTNPMKMNSSKCSSMSGPPRQVISFTPSETLP